MKHINPVVVGFSIPAVTMVVKLLLASRENWAPIGMLVGFWTVVYLAFYCVERRAARRRAKRPS